jgi:hypothetical protein
MSLLFTAQTKKKKKLPLFFRNRMSTGEISNVHSSGKTNLITRLHRLHKLEFENQKNCNGWLVKPAINIYGYYS